MKYYIFDGHNQFGPFSKIELIKKGISKDTFVWFEGLSEWKKAGDIEELSDLFSIKQIPPSPPSQKPQIPSFSKSAYQQYNAARYAEPKEKKKSKKKIVFWCFGVFFFLLVLAVVGYYYYEQYEEQEIQYKTENREVSNPEWFLSIENNIITDNTLTGYIVNSSNYTTYKRIHIQFSYYDKNGNLLQTNAHTINGTYYPHTSTPFKVKIRLPQGAKNYFNSKSYGVEVIGAEI